MKKKEMNSIYGKCVRENMETKYELLFMNGQFVTVFATHESIYVNHLRSHDVDLCLHEILESFFVDWMINELMRKFWLRAPLVLFENHTYLSMQMIQDTLTDVLDEYFTNVIIDEIISEVYNRCEYERICCWAAEEEDENICG